MLEEQVSDFNAEQTRRSRLLLLLADGNVLKKEEPASLLFLLTPAKQSGEFEWDLHEAPHSRKSAFLFAHFSRTRQFAADGICAKFQLLPSVFSCSRRVVGAWRLFLLNKISLLRPTAILLRFELDSAP